MEPRSAVRVPQQVKEGDGGPSPPKPGDAGVRVVVLLLGGDDVGLSDFRAGIWSCLVGGCAGPEARHIGYGFDRTGGCARS